jgi:hypothetical protein
MRGILNLTPFQWNVIQIIIDCLITDKGILIRFVDDDDAYFLARLIRCAGLRVETNFRHDDDAKKVDQMS